MTEYELIDKVRIELDHAEKCMDTFKHTTYAEHMQELMYLLIAELGYSVPDEPDKLSPERT